jgi:uncharacterized protein (UPF0335 family)
MEVSAAISGDQLRNIVERIEHVEHEIQELADAKKEIYLEAKGNGFDVKILREVICASKTLTSMTSTNLWSKYICRPSKEAPQQQERRCPAETAEQGTAQGPRRRRSGGHHGAWYVGDRVAVASVRRRLSTRIVHAGVGARDIPGFSCRFV